MSKRAGLHLSRRDRPDSMASSSHPSHDRTCVLNAHQGDPAGGFTPESVRESGNPRASAKAAQKVRRREQGHRCVEALLISLGAPVPRAGPTGPSGCGIALVAVGARNLRHQGPHRYVFRLGKDRREREAVELGLPDRRPYPKRPDPVTETTGTRSAVTL